MVLTDVYLDDNTDNLIALSSYGHRAVCFDRPWNQDWHGERVYSYREFIELLTRPGASDSPPTPNKQTERQKVVSGGIKYDEGKPRYDLLPTEALEEIVRVYTYGCQKYEANNWRKGIEYSRLFAACQRHLWKFWRGEDKDTESGLHHLAHAGFSILGMLQFALEGRSELDDRWRR